MQRICAPLVSVETLKSRGGTNKLTVIFGIFVKLRGPLSEMDTNPLHTLISK